MSNKFKVKSVEELSFKIREDLELRKEKEVNVVLDGESFEAIQKDISRNYYLIADKKIEMDMVNFQFKMQFTSIDIDGIKINFKYES